MPDQIYIGKYTGGLKLNPLPFNIDNDAFATLFNMYAWRGRIKRKRGTLPLARLQRQVELVASGPLPWQYGPITVSGGAANLLTGLSLPGTPSLTPGTIDITDGVATYTEPATPNGTLIGTGGKSGTINYATGAITLTGGGATVYGEYSYFPDQAVIGLEDYINNTANSNFPQTLGFDKTYAYLINQASKLFWYSVSYYKNTNNPVVWSSDDSNLFWTTNYQSAFWATNNKPGLHYLVGSYVSGSPGTAITFTFTAPTLPFTTLIVGDILWFNEWGGASTINGQTGVVTTIVNAAAGQYTVTFTTSQTVANTGGFNQIAQMITNSLPGQDGIRWFDGDPTSLTGLPTSSPSTTPPFTNLGWANFAPPLTATSVSINDQTPALYYLVGALIIIPFKDHLVFFAPQIQSISGGAASPVIQMPLQDTAIWSWNGTPYYNALVPTNSTQTETFNTTAYYVDQTGKGDWLSAGLAKPIMTLTNNEDVLLVGFGGTGNKTRFVYTGNDLNPFLFYLINSEIPSSCTFSGVTLDRGGIEIGSYGITLTTQQSSQRIDLDIPDTVFQIQGLNNGQKRVNAIRDYFKEWIYFAYPTGNGVASGGSYVYPSNTLLWNYRDNTWAIFRENFTAHGNFRLSTYYTWATLPFPTWESWTEPWNSGNTSALFPVIIAGNPQGYVVKKGEGVGEAPTGDIQGISSGTGGFTQIFSPNHCVNTGNTGSQGNGDYLYFQNCIGSTYLNGQIGLVRTIIDANNFLIDILFTAGTYLGLGTYTRLIQPLLQTKQFPFYWEQGRQVRLGVQKYLMDFTPSSQCTVNIYLSQDPDTVYNQGPINPFPATNNALVASQVLFTCPEGTNIGLTPPNVNLQQPTAEGQFQIWHRINTSLVGDSVQIGITLSDSQMRNLLYATSEVTLHAMHLIVYPAGLLA